MIWLSYVRIKKRTSNFFDFFKIGDYNVGSINTEVDRKKEKNK